MKSSHKVWWWTCGIIVSLVVVGIAVRVGLFPTALRTSVENTEKTLYCDPSPGALVTVYLEADGKTVGGYLIEIAAGEEVEYHTSILLNSYGDEIAKLYPYDSEEERRRFRGYLASYQGEFPVQRPLNCSTGERR